MTTHENQRKPDSKTTENQGYGEQRKTKDD